MKKALVSLTALLASALLLTTSAVAANNRSDAVNVGAGKGTPTIDGVVSPDEWSAAPEITVTLDDAVVKQYGEYQGTWADERDPADFSTYMKFMLDDEALYILEQRFDDYCELGGTALTPWGGSDGNLIFIQTIDSGAKGNEDAWSHHVFYIIGDENGNWGGSTAVRICDGSVCSQETVQYSEMSVASKQIADGWVCEVRVPWSVFAKEIPSFVPGENVEIAMSMVPIDFDADGEFAQLSWFKQADQLGVNGGYDYGGWATMTLLPAPVVEAAPAEEAPAEEAAAEAPAAAPASAPKTADAGLAVAAAVMACAAGVVLSKKR